VIKNGKFNELLWVSSNSLEKHGEGQSKDGYVENKSLKLASSLMGIRFKDLGVHGVQNELNEHRSSKDKETENEDVVDLLSLVRLFLGSPFAEDQINAVLVICVIEVTLYVSSNGVLSVLVGTLSSSLTSSSEIGLQSTSTSIEHTDSIGIICPDFSEFVLKVARKGLKRLQL